MVQVLSYTQMSSPARGKTHDDQIKDDGKLHCRFTGDGLLPVVPQRSSGWVKRSSESFGTCEAQGEIKALDMFFSSFFSLERAAEVNSSPHSSTFDGHNRLQ